MKIKITLIGEGGCSTIQKCTKKQFEFLKKIQKDMGNHHDEAYSPMMFVKECRGKQE